MSEGDGRPPGGGASPLPRVVLDGDAAISATRDAGDAPVRVRRATPDDAAAYARSMGDPGTALMAALCDYADNGVGALRLELTVYIDNAVAIALYRRFGFEVEGTFRGYALRDGAYVDAYAMARLHPRPPRIGAAASDGAPRTGAAAPDEAPRTGASRPAA